MSNTREQRLGVQDAEPINVPADSCVDQRSYKAQQIPEYRGNPFTEILPEIMDKRTFFQAAARQPPYEGALRGIEDHLRRHMIGQIFDLIVPLPRHYTEKTVLDRMIRRGYQARNPLPRDFWIKLDQGMDKVRDDIKLLRMKPLSSELHYVGCSSDLNTLKIGPSGCGKTTSSEISLRMYPQVFRHGEYLGHRLNRTQVIWVRLQAPHHGSAKDLCRSFFREMDTLLGTEYTLLFGKGDVESMLDQMIRIAAIHGVGLLVIDEVQEFSLSKSGGKDALVGFLLRLTNTIGIPVLLIGTYKASKVLFGQMRHIRRSTGIGMPDWGPLEHSADEWCANPQMTEWSLFVRALWKYQYTRTDSELTPELSQALFDECQGIPDFAKKIYFLVQDRLIATRVKGGKELITVTAIRSVARDYLNPARRLIQALREKDRDFLEKFDDVQLPEIEDYQEQKNNVIHLSTRGDDNKDTPGEASPVEVNVTKAEDPKIARPVSRKTVPIDPIQSSQLSAIVGDKVEDCEEAYKRLARAGFVKSGTEFWT